MQMSLNMQFSLSKQQRKEIRNQMLCTWYDLLGRVRNCYYSPLAVCPGCYRVLEPLEIMRGFNSDPADFKTTCPNCSARFIAELQYSQTDVPMTSPLLCPVQVLAQLEMIEQPEDKDLAEFLTRYQTVYHSSVIHFGSLKAAFKQIGVEYYPTEKLHHQLDIFDSLGKLPDTWIARVFMVSPSTVRRLRKQKGIPAYSYRLAMTQD